MYPGNGHTSLGLSKRNPDLVMQNNRAGSREDGGFVQRAEAKLVDFGCQLQTESVSVLGGGAECRCCSRQIGSIVHDHMMWL